MTRYLTLIALLGAFLVGSLPTPHPALAQATSRYFSETQHNVVGLFFKYWIEHGALAQQGYPLTEAFPEVSILDGKTYTVQYFERSVFEQHPENAGTPYEVLLSQLGTYELRTRYPGGDPASAPSIDNPRVFTETGHTIGGRFRTYWEGHGGLAQQGYPLTDEFQEQNRLNSQTYIVQYFERAIFEYHPENAGSTFEVLLTQLGKYQIDGRYPNNSNPAAAPQPPSGGPPPATAGPVPTAPPAATQPPAPTAVPPTAPPAAQDDETWVQQYLKPKYNTVAGHLLDLQEVTLTQFGSGTNRINGVAFDITPSEVLWLLGNAKESDMRAWAAGLLQELKARWPNQTVLGAIQWAYYSYNYRSASTCHYVGDLDADRGWYQIDTMARGSYIPTIGDSILACVGR